MSLPIFYSHYSIGKSILSLEKPQKQANPDEKFDENGTISVFDITLRHNLKQVCIVDSSMGGFYEAYSFCKKNDIQLCYGVELTLCNDVNDHKKGSIDTESKIIVWLKNAKSYNALVKLYSNYQEKGYFQLEKSKPGYCRIDMETLNQFWSEDFILTIPFYSGYVGKNCLRWGSSCYPVFGKIKPTFQINEQGLPFDEILGREIKEYCKNHEFSFIETRNVYYYLNNHVDSLQMLRALDQRSTFDRPNLEHFSSDQFSYESGHKEDDYSFLENFKPYVIDQLDRGVRLPEIKISNEQKKKVGLKSDASNYDYLCSLVAKGLYDLVLQNPKKKDRYDEYVKRCDEELKTFKKLNIVDYPLLVQDYINFARQEKIPTGLGRGSVCGSLVCNMVGITSMVDPIEHSLFFSRFISEARAQSKIIDGIVYHNGSTMPDVDSDFSFRRRDEIIQYINKKYPGQTARIGTLNTLTGKILIKEAVKYYLNYSEVDAKHISTMVERIFGRVIELKKVPKESEPFKKWLQSNPKHYEAFEICRRLEDLIKTKGQHASGIAITYDKIDEFVPSERSADGQNIVTSYDMKSIANIAIKVDILGLKNLDVTYDACELVGIKMEDIDVNHESIYKYLQSSSDYHGLFQIEKGLGKDTIIKVKPNLVEDVSTCVAIGRPGAMKYIDSLVRFRETGEMESIYVPIDKILENTAGIMIYQEQINQVCQDVYQVDPISAESIRRAIGKKEPEEMKKWEPIIRDQGKKLNIPDEVTDRFWSTCLACADYQFNKSHSEAYAYLAAINTYLKANYPKEFFISLLCMASERTKPMDEIAVIQREMNNRGIKLLPPSITKSGDDFTMEPEGIRYGLSAIKNIADESLKKINNFNRENSNKFQLFQNCKESKLDLRTVSPLILSGCLSVDDISRPKLLLEYQTFNQLTPREIPLVFRFGEKFNYELFPILKYLATNTDEDGKSYIKPSRLETIRKNYQGYRQIYNSNKKNLALTEYLFEKEILGFSYSHTLIDIFKKDHPDIRSIYESVSDATDTYSTFIGSVQEIKEGKSREKKTPYIKAIIADETAELNFMVFNQKMKPFFNEKGQLPPPGLLVIARGVKKDNNTFFGEWVEPLWDMKTVKKISEIKDETGQEAKTDQDEE